MANRIVNLTRHDVNLLLGSHMVTITPSGLVARVHLVEVPMGVAFVKGREVPISRLVPESVTDLPEPRPRTWFIVSSIVAQHVRGRDDLLVPYRSRRRGGRVVGCKGLASI